ncbi:MAG: hypothetical protein HOY78_30620 [Saccharothrix sp.]|nr:hypothetical protein [Saccharothrix sp.]
MTTRSYVPNPSLGRLVGARLYSVRFVHDYLQLHFDTLGPDQPVLTCDVLPAAIVDHHRHTHSRPGYADALRSLIGTTVLATDDTTGTGLRIELDGGSLVLHPTPAEVGGPEIATLTGFTDGQWMCWRPGEDSFEYLA